MGVGKKSRLRETEAGGLDVAVDVTVDAVVTETLQFHFLKKILFTN